MNAEEEELQVPLKSEWVRLMVRDAVIEHCSSHGPLNNFLVPGQLPSLYNLMPKVSAMPGVQNRAG